MLMKIEASFTVNLIAKSYQPVLQVSSRDIYKIKPHQKITLRINNKNYYSAISLIKYDSKNKYYKVSLTSLPINLVPESIIETKVIYDTKKLYETILD